MVRLRQAFVSAALLALPLTLAAPSAGQVEFQRSFDRGDWKIHIRRDLWTDQIDAIAQTSFVPLSPSGGHAGITMHCFGGKPGFEFSWPRRVTTSGGERSVFYIRIGRAPPVAAWLSVIENEIRFRGVLALTMTTLTEQQLLTADEITFGPEVGGAAAHISTKEASDAWKAIREICPDAPP